jgi:hypothetical protein
MCVCLRLHNYTWIRPSFAQHACLARCTWGGVRYAFAMRRKREQEVVISSRKKRATYRYLILYFIYNICLFWWCLELGGEGKEPSYTLRPPQASTKLQRLNKTRALPSSKSQFTGFFLTKKLSKSAKQLIRIEVITELSKQIEMKQFYVFLVLVAAASAASESDGLLTTALKFVKDCNDKSITLCIKVRPAARKSADGQLAIKSN